MIMMIVASCASSKKPSASKGSKTLTGMASYYANKYNGRKTASGERYRSKKFTAAHKTLPFGTVVKVTNLKNGKSVIVKINDRGPYSKGRIIDLSKAAAKQIDMINDGVVKVKVELTGKKEPIGK
jgi:rare lipoprotein A